MGKQTATWSLKEYKVPGIVGGIDTTPTKNQGVITATRPKHGLCQRMVSGVWLHCHRREPSELGGRRWFNQHPCRRRMRQICRTAMSQKETPGTMP